MIKLIAIIDDELEMEYIYSLMLEELIDQQLVRMSFFSDARVFIDWLQANPVDLILSDISMPHLSGPELGHRIREINPRVPIYFVSGHEQANYQEAMKELGICRYLTKPLDIDVFLQTISSELGIKG